MASRPPGPFVLEVTFEPREDGGLRAYCDKVPGFVLSHSNAEAVLNDVEPALETILSAMYGMKVKVSQAEPVLVTNQTAQKIELLPAYMCGTTQYVGVRANH